MAMSPEEPSLQSLSSTGAVLRRSFRALVSGMLLGAAAPLAASLMR